MDPIQALFLQAHQKTTNFPQNSRYHHTETAVLLRTEGDPVVYLKRRFIPPVEAFSALQEHLVQSGERLDNITYQYLGDPELYWQICDANGAMHPLEITEVTNRTIRISMPHGFSPNNV
jgi:hypothetical protein